MRQTESAQKMCKRSTDRGIIEMTKLINKAFKEDWENMSPQDKRHIIKMIVLLACLTIVPVICIACSMATGAMWVNEP